MEAAGRLGRLVVLGPFPRAVHSARCKDTHIPTLRRKTKSQSWEQGEEWAQETGCVRTRMAGWGWGSRAEPDANRPRKREGTSVAWSAGAPLLRGSS